MEALRSLQNRIDALTLRERAIVLAAILLAVYFIFETFVIEPINLSQKAVQSKIAQTNKEIAAFNGQMQKLLAASPGNQQQKDRQEAQRLKQEQAGIDRELQEATASLVAPQQMAKLLEKVLAQTNGLRLGKVTSLGSSPLLLQGQSAGKSDNNSPREEGNKVSHDASVETVYKHGLRIEFNGDFFATLDYLRKLEKLEWNFFWDNIKFQVKDYPEATSVLTLYTISLNKNWIGI